MSWAERADAAQGVLVGQFWDGRRGLYRVTPGRRIFPTPQWHYWWQAHALDATVDAVGRTGDAGGRERVRAHVAGVVRRNGGRIPNEYYDDMAWMALALLRADEVAGVDTAGLVAELWADIRQGWDERHGGVVWDGIHPVTDPGPSRELYTYNQGTVVGAEVELWRITGDTGHRDRAERTAAAALARFTDPASGLLPAEGAGDGGLFKGILARYLGELVRAVGPEPDQVTGAVLAVLRRNGEAVAAVPDRPVGADWRAPAGGDRSLSTHLSAVLLLEALAAVDPADSVGR
ncbi:MAG TPA: glycoside hydrolase family 76 protein [Mycobacteriales bacterium]|nr:glycoside hydrolase family 76 protein [Mycobacteriales bacterium]